MDVDLCALDRRIEELVEQRSRVEAELLADPDPYDVAVAVRLHERTCSLDHQDRTCGWGADTRSVVAQGTPVDWAHPGRRDWLLRARRLREKGIATPELVDQAVGLLVPRGPGRAGLDD